MSPEIEAILIEALDALEVGDSIADILARYPEAADELRPILETATSLSQLSHSPSPAVRRAGRLTFLEQANQLRGRPLWQMGHWWAQQSIVLAPYVALLVIAFSLWFVWTPSRDANELQATPFATVTPVAIETPTPTITTASTRRPIVPTIITRAVDTPVVEPTVTRRPTSIITPTVEPIQVEQSAPTAAVLLLPTEINTVWPTSPPPTATLWPTATPWPTVTPWPTKTETPWPTAEPSVATVAPTNTPMVEAATPIPNTPAPTSPPPVTVPYDDDDDGDNDDDNDEGEDREDNDDDNDD